MNVQTNAKAKPVPRQKPQTGRVAKNKAYMTSLQNRSKIHRAMILRKMPRGG